MLPKKEEVQRILAPYMDDFNEAIIQGFAQYVMLQRSEMRLSRKRSQSNALNDFIIRKLETKFNDSRNMKCFQNNNTIDFIVDCRVLIRVKKSNERGMPSNIPTHQVKLISNDPQLNLLPALMPVFLLYKPDSIGLSCADIILTSLNGTNKIAWACSIMNTENNTKELPLTYPLEEPQKKTAKAKLKPGAAVRKLKVQESK